METTIEKHRTDLQSVEVPFGKGKGKTVEQLVRDKEYAKWLLSQSWFKNHKIYEAVVAEINRKHNATIGVSKVYFVINEHLTRLKIGTSVHPKKRLRQIQTGNPDKLALYGAVLGDRQFEQRLHKEFQQHRVSGEWFAFQPCKPRVDEILSKDREVIRDKTYSMWEFRLITGLTERQVRHAESIAAKSGIVSRAWMQGGGQWDCLRDYNGDVRGWVWCKIVESGVLENSK